ncbi:penicillin-binding protein activator [Mariprofundus ferrooxydans]|uniref:ABC-type branched-chain amino acid transport systems periplasmic component-like protein n=1 Tax=Mariprofundus ferrooxydans PV-1 TaxID=314345 RepID=Q0F074_9PROT|nr:penicillin-binding protein activator [Mariprofundus ferrooxydans]EAU54810.1 ABC-type branched-chain amino acid transport systems periplasmic component-like protein [Mariprofundus ferrooxydans PV-1]KON46531.1 branched-chain amino acid ABC transporter substrate-binding protein [Mariprofundus ferrooxydans]
MLWKHYPSGRLSAMPAIVIAAMAAMLLLAGCQPKTPPSASVAGQKTVSRQLATAPETATEIRSLMIQAAAGGDMNQILAQFDTMIAGAAGPMREEALFRKAEVMLEYDLPGAEQAVAAALARYPQHALVPYAYVWRAEWWLKQGESDRALADMRTALLHPRLTRELADRILEIGPATARVASEMEAVRWFLAAAYIDVASRDTWLRMAARRSSLDTVERVFADPTVQRELLPAFALYSGQSRLMTGDIAAVQRIAVLLAASMPRAPQLQQLQAWASGEMRAATIGVMLPLTGQYARYGREALQGIRVALASLESDAYITLRVEDTASDKTQAIEAYRQLSNESVNMIIGPLLAETTKAILPYLRPGLPVISLTGDTELAHRSPSLFIHTLSPLAQVSAMANYAWQHDAKRMVVITDADENQAEADTFVASFEALGGELVKTVKLDKEGLDYRDQLRQLRFDTDDEETLAALDEDLSVFLPEMDVEIHMPVNFDAIYLALPGRQVALLAGQLAYADIRDVALYGSSRWQDGHLLDDRGRYLSSARFVASGKEAAGENDDPLLNRIHFMLREAWGSDATSDLLLLAYDSMRIATMLTSRLGLSDQAILRGLRDPEGFPAVTGHVRFDDAGVGQKQLDIFTIRKGEIVPAG